MRVIFIFFSILLFTGCKNNPTITQDNNKEELTRLIRIDSINNDSMIYYVDKNGVRTGEFVKYRNLQIHTKGFFKNDVQDSIFYKYEDGKVRFKSYAINGKENGLRYSYYRSIHFVQSEAFIEDGKRRYQSVGIEAYTDNKPYWINYFYLSIINDTIESNIGNLLMDTNYQVVPEKSSFYYVVGDSMINDLIVSPYGSETDIYVKFYRIVKDSEVKIMFGTLDEYHSLTSIEKTGFIDSTGFYLYSVLPKVRGWNYVRGQIIETKKSLNYQRQVPLYFNYYAY
ncbi:MAG: hypothetical protein JXR34_04315 [Bacteroidales bacterium]|nr:hypothetical protein [Bacteroidales bacterium]